MKKIILLSLLISFSVFSANAQLTFYENFEDFDATGYTMDATASLSTTQSVAGANSIYLAGGTGSHTNGFEKTLNSNITPDYFSIWIYTGGSSTAKSKGYVTVQDNSSNYMFSIYYNSVTSNYKLSSSSGPTIYFDISNNTWTQFELKNIDFTAHTFDVYLQGELLYRTYTFNPAASNVETLRLYNYSTATAAESYTYFDEIKFTESGSKILCSDLSTAYATQDTICEGDDITFVSQSSVSGENSYIWSEYQNPSIFQILNEDIVPSFVYTPTTVGNNTLYAGRSCLADQRFTTTLDGTSSYPGIMFDVSTKSYVYIDKIWFNYGSTVSPNTNYTVSLYLKDTSFVGFETNSNAWVFLGSQTINSGNLDSLVAYDMSTSPLGIAANKSTALYLYVANGGKIQYSGGGSLENSYNDANITVYKGSGTGALFASALNPRMPNIMFDYRTSIDIDQVQTANFGTTSTTYSSSGYIRGMAFLAPVDFTITGVQVPDDMSSTGDQTIKVVKFKKGMPSQYFNGAYADSNDFIVLGYWKNNASSTYIDCNIPIASGDLIGIFGGRGGQHFPYGSTSGTAFSINGEDTPIYRLGSNVSSLNSIEEYYDIWLNPGNAFSRTMLKYKIGTNSQYSNLIAIDYVVEDCTGIEEMDNIFAVNLYPNPSNGNFSLDIEMSESSNIQIQVFDAQGRYVTSIQDNFNFGSNVLNLDFSHLTAGLYHLNIINNEQAAQISFMITK